MPLSEHVVVSVSGDRAPGEAWHEPLGRLRAVLADVGLVMVFQPIFALAGPQRPVGYEALSRFTHLPVRPPDVWFADAEDVGLRGSLELAAVGKAFAVIDQLPPGAFLTVNLSPTTVLDDRLPALLRVAPLDRVVLEITEQVPIHDYDAVLAALRPFRADGLRIAVDDLGAGYASLRHVLRLQPEILKLDAGFTHGIDAEPMAKAMVAALVGFSRETGSRIVAEGVETAAELTTLRQLGVQSAQGFFLGPPAPLGELHN